MPTKLPAGSTGRDTAGWRLAFTIIEHALGGNTARFVRTLILLLVCLTAAVGTVLVLGPLLASGIATTGALTRAYVRGRQRKLR